MGMKGAKGVNGRKAVKGAKALKTRFLSNHQPQVQKVPTSLITLCRVDVSPPPLRQRHEGCKGAQWHSCIPSIFEFKKFKEVQLQHVGFRCPYHLQIEPSPHIHSQNRKWYS